MTCLTKVENVALCYILGLGEMAERLKATVSKTVVPVSGTVGSNPTLSANLS